MEKNGSGTSASPWYLILALPNYTGSAPTITNTDVFTLGAVSTGKDYLPSSPDLYTFTGTTGDSSMNAPNMFGANELAAFGSTPSFFDVFVYTFTPELVSNIPYEFTFGGSGLPNGTFLAASGGSNPFSTPFTVTGLVNGPVCTSGGCGGQVPEPTSWLLMGTGLLGLIQLTRRRAPKGC